MVDVIDLPAPALTRSEKAVLAALRQRCGRPTSVAELARISGYSEAAVTKARRRLKAVNLLDYTPGTGRTYTLYRLPDDLPLEQAPAVLREYSLGRTVASGVLHLLELGGPPLPPLPDEFRLDTVCRPAPKTGPIMELALGPVDWSRMCRPCLATVSDLPDIGQSTTVATTWHLQVQEHHGEEWVAVGKPHSTEPAARSALTAYLDRHPGARGRLAVRTTTETPLP
ncbi:hypothetical protein ACGRHY_28940 [Streptomyces sp. HK10]|uniref:hypothetical protein n=1 Tax=Streptomyces sp. HK10 TaxID=3373255 RepID=UPI00374A7010